jgi:hypothetical protein
MIKWLGILFICTMGLLLGFQKSSHVSKEQAVQNEIERRLDLFKMVKEKECMKLAIERAEAIVDSVIHNENSIPLIDTMVVPIRPVRPLKEKNIDIDTNEQVEPLFKKQQ